MITIIFKITPDRKQTIKSGLLLVPHLPVRNGGIQNGRRRKTKRNAKSNFNCG